MPNITLYKPFNNIELWNEDFDDLLEGFWDNSYAPTFSPKVEINEKEKGYSLKLETPGMKKEDISVEVEGNTLKLRGEKKEEKKEKNETCFFSERAYGHFERSFKLPENVKPDEIKAHYENGVIELTIPKGVNSKPKTIKVNVA